MDPEPVVRAKLYYTFVLSDLVWDTVVKQVGYGSGVGSG